MLFRSKPIGYKIFENTLQINSNAVKWIKIRDVNGRLINQSVGNTIKFPSRKGIFFISAELDYEIVTIKILN